MAGQLPARVRQAGENYVSLLQVVRCVYADRVTAGYLSVQLRLSRHPVSGKDGQPQRLRPVTELSDGDEPCWIVVAMTTFFQHG